MAAPEAAQAFSNLSSRLTPQDASFLYGESFHGPLHIGSISWFDGQLSYEDLKRWVDARLHLLPRYRQRLGFVPFNLNHAAWEDDPQFRIENHVHHHQLNNAGEEEMLAAAMAAHEPLLDRSRPLWDVHLFTGLADGRSAMLQKVHHCMIDGASGVELSTVLMDFEPEAPEPEPPPEPWAPTRPRTPAEAITAGVFDLFQSQLDAARNNEAVVRRPELWPDRANLLAQAGRTMLELSTRPVVNAPWNRPPISFRRRLSWLRLPFGEIRGVRGVLGGTVNDVVLAMLSEGAARYLQGHGYNATGQVLRIGCPVNVRREGENGALGNRVSMMYPTLPAQPLPADQRLAAVISETARIKQAREAQGLELLLESANLANPAVTAMASAMAMATMDATATASQFVPPLPIAPPLQVPGFGSNFVATNVPGVQVPQFLAGRRMTDSVGLIPLGGNLGYGVAIMSYNQNLYFGLMGEPRVMPDVDAMRDHVFAAYEDLKAAALAASPA
jgi:WS/DGAT/MGAT family acyltransferase